MSERLVKEHWVVQYEEARFPFIQKGWVLPANRYKDFDPFILMAEDWFKRGAFSDHPHRGFQTVTYVVDGRLEHIDNAGGHSILEPGDIQYMNAGWAARHGEEGVDQDIAHTLQLWLNLPKSFKRTPTTYQDVHSEDAPILTFDGGYAKIFSGEFSGIKGPLNSLVPITLAEIHLEAGQTYEHVLPASHNAFMYMLGGDVSIGDVRLKKHGVALFGEGDSIKFLANARRTRFLVYSGEPIREEIVQYGPFVMNTMEEIQEAYRDYQKGEFGPPAIK